MLVSSISPAPEACISRAQAMALRPVGVRPPWVNTSQLPSGGGPCVDRHHHALAAEFFGGFAHQIGAGDGGGVDAAFVGARQQQAAHILRGADAAADREGQEDPFGGFGDNAEDGVAVFVARCDVQESELVGAGLVVDGGLLDGVAGVAQIDEVDAFDDTAIFDVETGDDAKF